MVLATAAFVALPLPSGCDVPTGALSHTGVMIKRNELLLRSRATISLGSQLRDLEEDMQIIDHELKFGINRYFFCSGVYFDEHISTRLTLFFKIF